MWIMGVEMVVEAVRRPQNIPRKSATIIEPIMSRYGNVLILTSSSLHPKPHRLQDLDLIHAVLSAR